MTENKIDTSIQYKIGNLFEQLPVTKNPIVIPHIVNSIGAWGSGFVVPLGRKWPITEQLYLAWERDDYDPERDIHFGLGEAQVILVQPKTKETGPIFVVNMVGQDGVMGANNPHPIKYGALARCMYRVYQLGCRLRRCETDFVEIIAPAFGSLRAGGDWKTIEGLIRELWNHAAFHKSIYTLNEQEQQNLLKSLEG
jgi:hypothetical protein